VSSPGDERARRLETCLRRPLNFDSSARERVFLSGE
jgi:hypothetical protein